jgi:hypothetical protein
MKLVVIVYIEFICTRMGYSGRIMYSCTDLASLWYVSFILFNIWCFCNKIQIWHVVLLSIIICICMQMVMVRGEILRRLMIVDI